MSVASSQDVSAAAASEEIVIDNTQAELVGAWTRSTYKANYYRTDYLYRPTGTGSEPYRVAAHARSRWDLRRLLLAPERCR